MGTYCISGERGFLSFLKDGLTTALANLELCVNQAGLKLELLLPLAPESWDQEHVSPYPAEIVFTGPRTRPWSPSGKIKSECCGL